MFHGGEVFATWLITGEVRTYNTRGGYFNQISPQRPVFAGGPGAWEVVTQFSTIDLDSGTLTGGKYWRLTPMVNWYLSDTSAWRFAYGYGSLNRFGLVGKTHFFQTPDSDAALIATGLPTPSAGGIKAAGRITAHASGKHGNATAPARRRDRYRASRSRPGRRLRPTAHRRGATAFP